jgi:predicted nuclease of predicted toxin-antitoxin system
LIVWVDAQLASALAPWITKTLGVDAVSIRRLGFVNASDAVIFGAAREANALVLTKDADFVVLLRRHGPPPRVLWARCGNTSNARMRTILGATFRDALALFESGEDLVEITDIAE